MSSQYPEHFWKDKVLSLEKQVKDLSEELRDIHTNKLVMNDIIPVCSSQERKAIFNSWVQWKESIRPTEKNCNCFNNAIGKFDSLEYQEGQPGVEPFNPETFRHICKDYDDYGYVWDRDRMSWEAPHIQTCGAWQSGADCMHGEGDDDWDFFDQLEDDTNHKYEIVYSEPAPIPIMSIETNTCLHGEINAIFPQHDSPQQSPYSEEDMDCCKIITSDPVDFFNYIADTYPMTWIKWNLGATNPLNEHNTKSDGEYNMHNEFVVCNIFTGRRGK